MMSRIIPAPPDAPDYRLPHIGPTLSIEERRTINGWAWHLWQRGIDPRVTEWPGWGYVLQENRASDIDLDRLMFAAWLNETGALHEFTAPPVGREAAGLCLLIDLWLRAIRKSDG